MSLQRKAISQGVGYRFLFWPIIGYPCLHTIDTYTCAAVFESYIRQRCHWVISWPGKQACWSLWSRR